MEMNVEERSTAIALASCPAVEPSTLRQLVRGLGTAAAVWQADVHAWQAVSRLRADTAQRLDRWRRSTDPSAVEGALRERGIRCTVPGDEQYPDALMDLPDPPVALFLAGQEAVPLDVPYAAVVGTRRASAYGLEAAAWITDTLVRSGAGVVSGMAVGIDTAAHRACLEAGGWTVAVLATGVDRCYPPANRRLYGEILAKGLLLSEYAPGTPVAKHRFPERNRLIAALGRITVVVQAGIKSGAQRTVDSALELGREVFAVPGPITTVHFQGCHRLIQDGAQLLADPQDCLPALGLKPAAPQRGRPVPDRWRDLYDALVTDLSAAALSQALAMDPARVHVGLLELELAGCVRRLPGGIYRRLR
jgi:DNA processing protein